MQLVRPLDDAPLQLLVDHDRARRRRAQRGRAVEDRGHEIEAVERPHRARRAGEREHRRREVDERDRVRRAPAGTPGIADRERDPHERRVRDTAVRLEQPRILAERLAVIAHEHDDRAVGEPARRELVEQAADLAVDRAQQRAVAVHLRRSRRGRPRAGARRGPSIWWCSWTSK